MSFLAPLALLALLALAGPLIAHALRQGRSRTIVFPATRFVRKSQATTKERRRLQDQWLLAVRLLSLVCLALLGATPLASCSRLSLARDRGASVAVLLVIDDSASMLVTEAGKTRLERALGAANELLLGTRSGDAVGVVLAGRPARLLLPPTTDLARARAAVAEIDESDRPTDLDAAVVLAEDALSRLPQSDKQIVLLTDQASPRPLPKTTVPITLPVPELARPFENCALLSAERQTGQVSAEIACTSGSLQAGRQAELVDVRGTVLARADLVETIVLPLKDDVPADGLGIRLTKPSGDGQDQIESDDRVDVEPGTSTFAVGLCADAKRSGLPTSGTTVLKAALDALDTDLDVDPIAVLPDHAAELENLALLLIDDPPGLTPEAASAIEAFVDRGGVVLSLLGNQVGAASLGAVFGPLVTGAPAWSEDDALGVAADTEGLLGPLAAGWADLATTGRVMLPEQPKEARVTLRFADGKPLVLERAHGQGLFITTLLPSSVEVSDFALRPAFLALLDRALYQARLRGNFAATEVGETWEIPEETTVTGPKGKIGSSTEAGRLVVVPDRAGRYTLRTNGKESARFARRTGQEAILQPNPNTAAGAVLSRSGTSRQATDISREVAFSLLVLMLLELGLRAQKRLNSRSLAWGAPAPGTTRAS